MPDSPILLDTKILTWATKSLQRQGMDWGLEQLNWLMETASVYVFFDSLLFMEAEDSNKLHAKPAWKNPQEVTQVNRSWMQPEYLPALLWYHHQFLSTATARCQQQPFRNAQLLVGFHQNKLDVCCTHPQGNTADQMHTVLARIQNVPCTTKSSLSV